MPLLGVTMERRIQLEQFMATITYKPGWKFRLDLDNPHYPALVVKVETLDTYDHHRPIQIHHRRVISPYALESDDPKQWTRAIFDQILAVERHEASEFFKVDGEMVYDPHKDGR